MCYTKLLSIILATAFVASAQIRVNVGGPQYTDSTGQIWQADTGCTSQSTYSRSTAIQGTTDPTLYRTGRIDPRQVTCSYTVAVPSFYTVTLLFAETDPTVTATTQSGGKPRVMNVYINNQLYWAQLNVLASSAFATAYTVTSPFIAVATDSITINVVQVAYQAMLSGLDIEETNASGAVTITGTQTITGDKTFTGNTAITGPLNATLLSIAPYCTVADGGTTKYYAFPGVSPTPAGDELLVVFHDGPDHQDSPAYVGLKRSTDGCSFGTTTEIKGDGVLWYGDPSLVIAHSPAHPEGFLLLTYYQEVALTVDPYHAFTSRSFDQGHTFDADVAINSDPTSDGITSPAVQLMDGPGGTPGTLLCATYSPSGTHIMQSTDFGDSWTQRGSAISSSFGVEPSLLIDKDIPTKVYLTIREGTTSTVFAVSTDSANTFTSPVVAFAANSRSPMVQDDATGRILTAYRQGATLPTNLGQGYRTSIDGGTTWTSELVENQTTSITQEYAAFTKWHGLIYMPWCMQGLHNLQAPSSCYIRVIDPEMEKGQLPTLNARGINMTDGFVQSNNGAIYFQKVFGSNGGFLTTSGFNGSTDQSCIWLGDVSRCNFGVGVNDSTVSFNSKFGAYKFYDNVGGPPTSLALRYQLSNTGFVPADSQSRNLGLPVAPWGPAYTNVLEVSATNKPGVAVNMSTETGGALDILSTSAVNIKGFQTVLSGTYISGGAITGTMGQTCKLQFGDGQATVALTGTNTIASGTALVILGGGLFSSAPTAAALDFGTASNCIGTAVISTTLSSGADGILNIQAVGSGFVSRLLLTPVGGDQWGVVANTSGVSFKDITTGFGWQLDTTGNLGVSGTITANIPTGSGGVAVCVTGGGQLYKC